IREAKTHQIYSVLQTGGQHGMQTMDSALAELVRAGVITKTVAEQRSSSPGELRRLVGGGAPGAPAGMQNGMQAVSQGAAEWASTHTRRSTPNWASRSKARSRPRTNSAYRNTFVARV